MVLNPAWCLYVNNDIMYNVMAQVCITTHVHIDDLDIITFSFHACHIQLGMT